MELPLGTQRAKLLDPRTYDGDADSTIPIEFEEENEQETGLESNAGLRTESDFKRLAKEIYKDYAG